LKDKVKISGAGTAIQTSALGEIAQEAVSALTMLGFNQLASQKVVSKIYAEKPTLSVEEIIKTALKIL
jgi:Holliday junction DNA helicase RuvA